MTDIRITRIHTLTQSKAKAAAQEMADQMAGAYGMRCEWEGNMLLFKSDSVAGVLTLTDDEARLEISLGLLFKAIAPTIEEKVTAKMEKVFGAGS